MVRVLQLYDVVVIAIVHQVVDLDAQDVEITGGNHAVEAIGDECQKRAHAITAEKLGVGFVTRVGRIGEVGKKMRAFCKPEVVVQACGEEVVGTLVLVPSEKWNDIVYMV